MMSHWRWILMTVLLTGAAWAQEEVSVALVNVGEVIREARPVRAGIEAVDAEVVTEQRVITRLEDELIGLIETHRSQSHLWSEEVRGQQERDIVNRRLDLDERTTRLQEMIDQSETDVIEPLFEIVYETIREIAEENEIDMVLRSDAAVYAAPDLDLTEEVITRLNERTDIAVASPEDIAVASPEDTAP